MTPHPRRLMFAALMLLIVMSGSWVSWSAVSRQPQLEAPSPTDPAAAIAELQAGNQRFIHCQRVRSVDTSHDADERERAAEGQHPFAAILCCADSRVCPEFIFDQRTGTLFEIRNAGNVVDSDVLVSLEFAVEVLQVPLIVVLGHKDCGAVKAVCGAGLSDLPGYLGELQRRMQGIRRYLLAENCTHASTTIDTLAAENARQQARAILEQSQIIESAVAAGNCRLISGLYDIRTGEVALSELDGF